MHERAPGVIDVDHQAPEFVVDRHRRYAELRERCPVVFNEHYGGFWIVTDYESVAAVARDNETFAHKYEPDADDGISYHGICGIPRPPYVPRMGVSEIDGPAHADLRRVLNPHMTPRMIERQRPRMEAVSDWFLDQITETGAADLVLDYATPVPAVLTLELMGMESANWKHYADFFHATSSYEPSDPKFRSAVARRDDMWAELRDFAVFRRANPAGDVTTALVTAVIDGSALSDDEITGIMWNLVAGGLDTTTSLVSWGLHHLGTHPGDRARLIDDPALIPAAVEEFLRYYSPSETLTRTAARDVELGGRQIRRGDVVLISWVAANHDPGVFPRRRRGAHRPGREQASRLRPGRASLHRFVDRPPRVRAHAGRRAGPHRRLRDRPRRLQALSRQPADDRRGVDAGDVHTHGPFQGRRPLRGLTGGGRVARPDRPSGHSAHVSRFRSPTRSASQVAVKFGLRRSA